MELLTPWDTAKGRAAEDRFWEKVDKTPGQGPNGDCWEWQAYRNANGYGVFGAAPGRIVLASRFAYELAHGPLGDLFACHRCDNPPCCRDEHLFAGDDADNHADMVAKGRHWWQQ